MAFALAGSLESPYVVSIDINIYLTVDSKKICLLIAEVLLGAAAGDLSRSKKQREWTLRNAVLLPPFLTEAAILDRETSNEELLKIFAQYITERVEEEEDNNWYKDDNESYE